MRAFSYIVAATVCLIATLPAKARSLATDGNDKWIVLASRGTLDEALEVAKSRRSSFVSVKVVRSANGWFGVVSGPYRIPNLQSYRQEIIRDGRAPEDVYFSNGERYTELVWDSSYESVTTTQRLASSSQATVAAEKKIDIRLISSNAKEDSKPQAAHLPIVKATAPEVRSTENIASNPDTYISQYARLSLNKVSDVLGRFIEDLENFFRAQVRTVTTALYNTIQTAVAIFEEGYRETYSASGSEENENIEDFRDEAASFTSERVQIRQPAITSTASADPLPFDDATDDLDRDGIAGGYCRNGQLILENQTLYFRNQGVPIDTARSVLRQYFRSETMEFWQFMRRSIDSAYRNPNGLREIIESSVWMKKCVRAVRGY